MSDVEADFARAVEPLVVEIETLRRDLAAVRARPDAPDLAPELAALKGEVETLRRERATDLQSPGWAPALAVLEATIDLQRGQIAALRDMAPKAEVIATLQARLDTLARHPLDVPVWTAGVHRQGAVVQHFHGQYFEAVADTAHEPGDGVAWKRLGTHGFRYRGLKIDGVEYDHGDLVQDDGSMLLQSGTVTTWLALRGRPGPRGAPGVGKDGAPGAPGGQGPRGADGAVLVKLEAGNGLLWAVMSDGRREPIALEAVALENSVPTEDTP